MTQTRSQPLLLGISGLVKIPDPISNQLFCHAFSACGEYLFPAFRKTAFSQESGAFGLNLALGRALRGAVAIGRRIGRHQPVGPSPLNHLKSSLGALSCEKPPPRPRKELYGDTMLLRITVSRRVVSHPRADPYCPHAISRRPEAGRLKHCIASLRCFATLPRRIQQLPKEMADFLWKDCGGPSGGSFLQETCCAQGDASSP
jgi:hypothetical protein